MRVHDRPAKDWARAFDYAWPRMVNVKRFRSSHSEDGRILENWEVGTRRQIEQPYWVALEISPEGEVTNIRCNCWRAEASHACPHMAVVLVHSNRWRDAFGQEVSTAHSAPATARN